MYPCCVVMLSEFYGHHDAHANLFVAYKLVFSAIDHVTNSEFFDVTYPYSSLHSDIGRSFQLAMSPKLAQNLT